MSALCRERLPSVLFMRFVRSPLTIRLQRNAAYPLSEGINPRIVVVQEGTDAILPPLISPGALRDELYFIDWQMGRNGTLETLAQIQGPRIQSPVTTMDQRYSVNPETFVLMIQSVTFEDRGIYFGVLGVRDPQGMEFFYEELRSSGVTLDVYGKQANNVLLMCTY